MKHFSRPIRPTALAAAYTAVAAALAYLIWFHFDPAGMLTWILVALWLLTFNLGLLAYRLAHRSIWGNTYAHPLHSPPSGRLPSGYPAWGRAGFTQTLSSTAHLLWEGELPPPIWKKGQGNGLIPVPKQEDLSSAILHPSAFDEHAYWLVPFENGRQVIVKKQEMLNWLYDCWFRQEYYRQTRKKLSAISQDLGDKELGRYQWQARIWLLDQANAIERNTTDRRSLPKLRYFPYKTIQLIENAYPSEGNVPY